MRWSQYAHVMVACAHAMVACAHAMVTCDPHTVKRTRLEKLHPDLSPMDFIRSSIGVFAFTGCDTVVSDFAGKGKIKAANLLM